MDFERFYFTQHALKAFDSCPLKFKKRYIEKIRWGEPPDESVRKQIQLGRDFHLLAQRYFMGIQESGFERKSEDDPLEQWGRNLKRRFTLEPGVRYLPEYKLRMSTGSGNLEANFDLLILQDSRITIWDWKTGSPPGVGGGGVKAKRLKTSLQTMVYLAVLKELAFLLMEGGCQCSGIKMCYWQPETEAALVEVEYSDALHEAFYGTLRERMETIRQYDYANFDKDQYRNHCRYCEFNTLCNRESVDYEAVHWEDAF